MEPWIFVTLAAATVQNVRTVLQKRLIGRLSVSGSTYARFLFGLPVAWLAILAAMHILERPLPHTNATFFAGVIVGGITQILGNALFVHLIRASNFTVITTYIKVETVIGAMISFVLLGDRLSPLGIAGVLITLVGIAVLSAGKSAFTFRALFAAFAARDALSGIAVGALYAVASTSFRGASLASGEPQPVVAALFTLACVTLFQMVLMTAWLTWRAPAIIRETARAWRVAAWVGVSGNVASGLWYTAFTLQVTAYVLALGQVELVLAYLASRFLFKEHTHPGEIAGIAIMMAGILAVAAAR